MGQDCTHRYVGPTTTWGLAAGAKCALLGRARARSGLVQIRTADGRKWFVTRGQLERLVR